MKTVESLWPAWMIMDTSAEMVENVYRFAIRGPKTRVDAETQLLRKRYAQAGYQIRITRKSATLAEIETCADPVEVMCSD